MKETYICYWSIDRNYLSNKNRNLMNDAIFGKINFYMVIFLVWFGGNSIFFNTPIIISFIDLNVWLFNKVSWVIEKYFKNKFINDTPDKKVIRCKRDKSKHTNKN